MTRVRRACGESAPVGAGFIAHLGGVDEETVPHDIESELTSCAIGCVRHCGWSPTRDTISADGLTSRRKLCGREYGGASAVLGETVLFHVRGLNQKFARRWEEGLWRGQDVVDRQAHLGDAVRQAVGAHSDTVQVQRQVYLTRGVVERFGPAAGCKACAGRGGSLTHECRARLEECFNVRERTRKPLRMALLPDSDVLEELASQRMEVDDAQLAAQEAQAQARPGPAAVPAELSTGSGARASSASKREIESREVGDTGAFAHGLSREKTKKLACRRRAG